MPFLTHFGHFQGPTGNVLTEKLPVDAYTDWGFRSKATASTEARPGRVFAPANTERRKGRRPKQSEGRMPQGAVTAGDWGFSERSDCLFRGATGPGICTSKYGKAKRSPAETK